MDSGKKVKTIIIILAFGGAVLLGLWAWKSRVGNTAGIGSVPEGKKVWVKCAKQACGASYEMAMKEYYMKVDEKVTYSGVPPIDCEKCGEESVFRAIKCKSCGEVFFKPRAGGVQCPKCASKETDSP
jgi:ribosomal protein S27E